MYLLIPTVNAFQGLADVSDIFRFRSPNFIVRAELIYESMRIRFHSRTSIPHNLRDWFISIGQGFDQELLLNIEFIYFVPIRSEYTFRMHLQPDCIHTANKKLSTSVRPRLTRSRACVCVCGADFFSAFNYMYIFCNELIALYGVRSMCAYFDRMYSIGPKSADARGDIRFNGSITAHSNVYCHTECMYYTTIPYVLVVRSKLLNDAIKSAPLRASTYTHTTYMGRTVR